jgi:hypothetical protein
MHFVGGDDDKCIAEIEWGLLFKKIAVLYGGCTVWHYRADGSRASSRVEAILADAWKKHKFDRDEPWSKYVNQA